MTVVVKIAKRGCRRRAAASPRGIPPALAALVMRAIVFILALASPAAAATTPDPRLDRVDVAGERIVTLRLGLAPHVFQLDDVAALTGMLDTAQTSMVADGANIGRTIVVVSDPFTSDPLYISGNDRLFTYRSAWYSPRVLAFAKPSAPAGPAKTDHATSTVTDALPGTGG